MNTDAITEPQAGEDPVDQRIRLQKHQAALVAFMESEAYVGFLAARRDEIRQTKEAIATIAQGASDLTHFYQILKFGGELNVLTEELTSFEDARDTLKTRIEEMLERENKSRQENK